MGMSIAESMGWFVSTRNRSKPKVTTTNIRLAIIQIEFMVIANIPPDTFEVTIGSKASIGQVTSSFAIRLASIHKFLQQWQHVGQQNMARDGLRDDLRDVHHDESPQSGLRDGRHHDDLRSRVWTYEQLRQ